MKLLNWTEFAACPLGTVYQKYEPCVTSELQIKGKTLYMEKDKIDPFDFYMASSLPEVGCAPEGTAWKWCHSYGRDGLFEYKQLYLVYEQKDLDFLISILKNPGRVFGEGADTKLDLSYLPTKKS